jgi:hypothetical protein
VLIEDPLASSMALFNFTVALEEAVTFVFGSWIYIANGSSDFSSHLTNPRESEALTPISSRDIDKPPVGQDRLAKALRGLNLRSDKPAAAFAGGAGGSSRPPPSSKPANIRIKSGGQCQSKPHVIDEGG